MTLPISLSAVGITPIEPEVDPIVDPGFTVWDYRWWVEQQMLAMVFGDSPAAIEPFELGEF